MSGEDPDLERLIGPQASSVPEARGEQTVTRRQHRVRMTAAGIVGAVIAAFALLNLNQVRVHWLFVTGRTPLIVVIAFALLLGIIADRLALRARRKRRGDR